MNKSYYEKKREETLSALRQAICESNYHYDSNYIIAIQNVTDNYNVDFTLTDDGEWADEVFEQDCHIAIDCAYNHKDTKYIIILAKSYLNGSIELLKDARVCIKSRTK